MAKKDTKIQKQLKEGLANAGKVVDEQIEGKAAPKTTKPPVAAAPSAPAAGGSAVPAAPSQVAPPTAQDALDVQIGKIIKGSQYFVDQFRKIQQGVLAGDSPIGMQDKAMKLAQAVSGSTGGQIPAEAAMDFITRKATASASPAVVQEPVAEQPPLSPEMQPTQAQTPPPGETTPTEAPTGLLEAIAAPAPAPENNTTASTLDQGVGLSPEQLAMLQAADEELADKRAQVEPQKDPAFKVSDYFTPEEIAEFKRQGLDPYQEALDVREFGAGKNRKMTAEEAARVRNLDQGAQARDLEAMNRLVVDADLRDPVMNDLAKKSPQLRKAAEERDRRLKRVLAARRAVLEQGSLNPIDDLYLLFDKYFGDGGLKDRPLLARDDVRDPESFKRGTLAMRETMFHYAFGFVEKKYQGDAQFEEFRKQFDAIMRAAGVEQALLDEVRSGAGRRGADAQRPYFLDQEYKNVGLQREMLNEIIRLIDELGDGGTLHRPDVASSVTLLTKMITEIDSDIVKDSYVSFAPTKPQGEKIQVQSTELENLRSDVVDKIKELTGEDIRVLATEEGTIRRPFMSLIVVNGVPLSVSNIVRYQKATRRRFAIDRSGIIDARWQQVDGQGLDVPSFFNPMHPEPESNKAAIGFILSTDATAEIQSQGGKGLRDGRLEGAIILSLKEELGRLGFDDSSSRWSDRMPTDIGVGENIEYTLDEKLISAESGRRRAMLPNQEFVIVRLDPEKFGLNDTIKSGNGDGRLIGNKLGILVLPSDHPLVEVATRNGASLSSTFRIGDDIDLTGIVGDKTFASLRIDIDPYVFPAVMHTLPLRTPKNRQLSLPMIPEPFVDRGTQIGVLLYDEQGNPVDQDWQGKQELAGRPRLSLGVWGEAPAVLIRDLDVERSSPEWRSGVATAVLGQEDGTMPDLGAPSDLNLPEDGYGDDDGIRWYLGDVTGEFDRGENRDYGRPRPKLGSVSASELRQGLDMIREDAALIESGTPSRDIDRRSEKDRDVIARVDARQVQGEIGRAGLMAPVTPLGEDGSVEKTIMLGEESWPIFKRLGVAPSQAVLSQIMARTEHIPFMATNIADYRAKVAMFVSDLLGSVALPRFFGQGPMGILSDDTDYGMMIASQARSLEGEAGSPGKSEKPRSVGALGRFSTGLYLIGPDGRTIKTSPRTSVKATPYTAELIKYIIANGTILKTYYKTFTYDPRLPDIMSSIPETATDEYGQTQTIDAVMRWRMAVAQLIMEHISEDPANYNFAVSEPLKLVKPKAIMPTRRVFDSGAVYEESQHPHEVSTRAAVDARAAMLETDGEDVIMKEASFETEPIKPNFGVLDPERAAKVRKLTGHLLTLLSIRGTKANFDGINARGRGKKPRDVSDIIDLAPELAAVYSELGRTRVVAAAQDAWIAKIRDRMPGLNDLEMRLLLRQLGTYVETTYGFTPPVSSTPGLSSSSRAAGAMGMQFIDWDDLGIFDDGDVSSLDREAYQIARERAAQDYLSRTGRGRQVGLDAVRESEDGMSTKDGTDTSAISVYDEIADQGGDFEALLKLVNENPDAIGLEAKLTGKGTAERVIYEGLGKEARMMLDAMRTSKDPRFRSVLIALIENKFNYDAIADSAYPDDFAKAILQEDKGLPESARVLKPRGKKDRVTRGVNPETGQPDPYDQIIQERWVAYVAEQKDNVNRKIGKEVGKNYKGALVDLPAVPSESTELVKVGARHSTAEWRRLAWKAWRYYSTHQAIDQAGDGWLKFVNNATYSDSLAQKLGDDFALTGGKLIFVDTALFAGAGGELPKLTTIDGGTMGILSSKFVDILKNTENGSALIDFAKAQQLQFVLIKKKKDGFPGLYDDEVYLAKATIDKKTGKFLEFDTIEQMTFEYGYQPLADETNPMQTEERVKEMLKQHGSEGSFDVIPTTDNTGRYMIRIRPETLVVFGLEDAGEANAVVEQMAKMRKYDSKTISRITRILDTGSRMQFFEFINSLAIADGVEPPFPGMVEAQMMEETAEITGKFQGLDREGRTSGPFAIRRAMNSGNENLGALATIRSPQSVVFKPGDAESDQVGIDSFLARQGDLLGETQLEGIDPMLDAALEKGSIRDKEVIKALTTSRPGAPLGSERRIETETNKQLFRSFKSRMKLATGMAGTGLGISIFQGAMDGGLTEDEVKAAAAFEALGAISPVASSAAALGFTAMNKGDMLRTLINILGGIGGGALGAAGGTGLMPGIGTFAGATAGSVAGSAAADTLYTAVAGNQLNNMVPNNVATGSQQAVPEEKDPFSIYRNGG